MKSGLFWKLLLAFWLTFFAITQGIWLMVNVLNITPVSERTLGERVAPLLLAQVSDALSGGGLDAATAMRATFPDDDQRRIDILPLPVSAHAAGAEDATVTRTVRDREGRAYEIDYHYISPMSGAGWLRMPLGMLVLGLIGGLLFGALVAWYLVLPIRRLQRGFERIASGDLSVRISPGSRSRHDELADLIRDFDVMAGRLDQSIRARDRLLSDVSHELRSPLSRLQLAIGLAQQDPDRLSASLERIRYEGRRLDSVIRELLTLTRTENDLPSEKGYFDIADVVHSVITDAQFEAESTGILIRFDRQAPLAGEETPALFGNAELVRWAVENVVRNAMRFSTPGQTVSIRLTYEPQASRFIIEVKDEGPGAPEGALPTLFDPFVRGEEASPGYGLGLAIAKRAVLAHGGEIEARNRSQSGLSVRIDLPVTGTGQRPLPTMQAARAPLA
jgi:two-component system OmpR family sensor kinase